MNENILKLIFISENDIGRSRNLLAQKTLGITGNHSFVMKAWHCRCWNRQNYHIPENGFWGWREFSGRNSGMRFFCGFDIVLGGEKPGTIYLIEDDEIPVRANFRHSMHRASALPILL